VAVAVFVADVATVVPVVVVASPVVVLLPAALLDEVAASAEDEEEASAVVVYPIAEQIFGGMAPNAVFSISLANVGLFHGCGCGIAAAHREEYEYHLHCKSAELHVLLLAKHGGIIEAS
jgi:hypothetical protein